MAKSSPRGEERAVPHNAPITRTEPSCVLVVIDQSGSMAEPHNVGGAKAETVESVVNNFLQEIVIRCTREDGVRDYFDVGVIGYGGSGTHNALSGVLGESILNPISLLGDHPLRVEDRMQKMPDGVGGLIEVPVKIPVWLDPFASGGTPMCAALMQAAEVLAPWCDAHPRSFPPVLLHLTDGEPTDGSPEEIAAELRRLHTDDGPITFMNIHISNRGMPIAFPASPEDVSDPNAAMLVRMSSPLLGYMREMARSYGYEVSDQSTAYMYNAGYQQLAEFFNIGTPQAQAMR